MTQPLNKSALMPQNRRDQDRVFPGKECAPNPACIHRYRVTIDAGNFLIHLSRAIGVGEGRDALAEAVRNEPNAVILRGNHLVGKDEFLQLLSQSSRVILSSASQLVGGGNACTPAQ